MGVMWCLCQSCITQFGKVENIIKGNPTNEKECEMCGEPDGIYEVFKVEDDEYEV